MLKESIENSGTHLQSSLKSVLKSRASELALQWQNFLALEGEENFLSRWDLAGIESLKEGLLQSLTRGEVQSSDFSPFSHQLVQAFLQNSDPSVAELAHHFGLIRRFFFSELGPPAQTFPAEMNLLNEFFARAVLSSFEKWDEMAISEKLYREQFVLEIAHDLRNPLTGIRANAQLLMRSPEKLERSQLLANRIVSSADRLDRMVSNLLDASQIRTGKRLNLELERFNLSELVHESVDQMRITYGDRFVLEAPEALFVTSNRDGLLRVIENLVTNAVKYGSADKPVRLTLMPQDSAKAPQEFFRFEVHNLGNPIPESEQAKLFQLFSRSSAAVSGGKRGWGIGLVLVKGIVEALGGSVEIESNLVQGTRFSLVLPMIEDKQHER